MQKVGKEIMPPTIQGWGEVYKGCKLLNFLHVFPRDDEYAEWADERFDNATLLTNARVTFDDWPETVQTPYFNTLVTMRHPDNGTVDGRFKHLTHNNPPSKNHGIAIHKCRWLPAVVSTLQNPHAILFDRFSGQHAFARKYRCNNIHLVFIKKIKDAETQMKSTVLVTHFPHQKGEGQDFLTLDWKR